MPNPVFLAATLTSLDRVYFSTYLCCHGKTLSFFEWARDPTTPVPPSYVVISTGWLQVLKKVREKGEREYRLVPGFLSQMIRWMEVIIDDSSPERKCRRTDMERKMS